MSNQHPAVALLSNEMKSSSDVRMNALLDVNPDFKNLKQNKKVKKFLEDLQSIHITESISISPEVLFYILIIVFLLPSIWSIVSVFLTDFPTRLYFNGCENRNNLNMTFNLYDCFTCCNNRSFVYSDLIAVPTRARVGQIVTVSLASVGALLSGPAYARLTLSEHMAIHFLTYGVVIKTEYSCSQLVTVLIFGLLFTCVSVLYVLTQSWLSDAFSDSILGFGDVCDSKSQFSGLTLHAIFSEGNPSLAAGSLPRSTLDYIKAFLVVFLPFLPVLLRLQLASTTTFSTLGLEHLVRDSKSSSALFKIMEFEVEEVVLLNAIERYADLCETDENIGRFLRRLIVCKWKMGVPMKEYFGFAWGFDDVDMQRVLTILREENHLNLYRPPTSSTTTSSPATIKNSNSKNDWDVPAKQQKNPNPTTSSSTAAAAAQPQQPQPNLLDSVLVSSEAENNNNNKPAPTPPPPPAQNSNATATTAVEQNPPIDDDFL